MNNLRFTNMNYLHLPTVSLTIKQHDQPSHVNHPITIIHHPSREASRPRNFLGPPSTCLGPLKEGLPPQIWRQHGAQCPAAERSWRDQGFKWRRTNHQRSAMISNGWWISCLDSPIFFSDFLRVKSGFLMQIKEPGGC